MFDSRVLLFLVAAAGCAACSSGTGPGGTTTMPTDLGEESYDPATIHEIDTDRGDGPFGDGKRVLLQRVVAVTDVDKYVNSTNQQCRYQIWVQDAGCMTPPCGLVVKAIGPKAPSPNATGKDCPAARLSGTLLDNVRRGDNLSLRGKLLFEPDNLPPRMVLEHQLFVERLDVLSEDQTIAALPITDAAQFAQFVTHTGGGWKQYEGMYLVLRPAMGTLQVSEVPSEGFKTIPGSTDWSDTFDNDYYPKDAVSFPSIGSTWHSIAGVVSARHGGELMPVRNGDFVP